MAKFSVYLFSLITIGCNVVNFISTRNSVEKIEELTPIEIQNSTSENHNFQSLNGRLKIMRSH